MSGSDDSTSPLPASMSVILDPVLAYVHAGMAAGTVEATTKATLSFFPREAIAKAKDVIYDKCAEVTGAKPKRRDGELRTATEADLQDIISAIRKVDTCSNPPTFAVPSLSLSSLPRSKPEELLSISIAERMALLEEQHQHMKEIMDGLVLNKLDHSFRLRKLEENGDRNDMGSYEPPPRYSGSCPPLPPAPRACLQQQQPPVPPKQHPPKQPMQKKPMSQPSFAAIAAALSEAAAAAGVCGTDDGEPFQLVRNEKKKRRKVTVIGKGDQETSLKGGPEPSRYLFIHRVDKASTTNDVLRHIRDKAKISPREIECKSHEESAFKSFKVTVAVSEYKALFDDQLWPAGVRVRPWRENPQNKPPERDSQKD